MIETVHGGLPLLHFELFGRFDELACGVSTRLRSRASSVEIAPSATRGEGPLRRAKARLGPGGEQAEPFNLGPVRGPDRGARSGNWRRFAASLGLGGIYPQLQVHGEQVRRVEEPSADFGSTPPADASFTGRQDIGLLAFSADCPLVAVYQAGVAVGVAHASWRCTTGLIVQRLVERMAGELGCRPSEMWAGISPGAGPCCYEVGEEVYESAERLPDRASCFRRAGGRLYFDLWRAAEQQLRSAGVPPERTETAGLCTVCRNDRFFSYRREGKGVGSFGLMIGRRFVR